MLGLAIVLTLVWTALAELRSPARRRLAYPKLFFWFRLIIRITLGVAMLGYGLAKLSRCRCLRRISPTSMSPSATPPQ